MKTLVPTNAANAHTLIPVDGLTVHPAADRIDPGPAELQALADSLLRDGQLSPVIARRLPDGSLQLIFGSRRLKAARLAGLTSITAEIREMSEVEALQLIGVENIIRRDFDPIQRGEYLARLVRPIKDCGAGMTRREIAKRFGKSESWLINALRLATLPEPWRSRVASREIPESSSRFIIPHLDNPAIMKALDVAYQRDPNIFKRGKKAESERKLQKLVSTFGKLESKQNGLADIAGGRGVQSSREAAISQATRDMYAEERIERQADQMLEVLEEDGELGVEVAELPVSPLSQNTAREALLLYWDSLEDLRLIASAAAERIRELGAAE